MFLQNSAAGSGDCGVGVNTAAPVCNLSGILKLDVGDLRLQTGPEVPCKQCAVCIPQAENLKQPVGSICVHPVCQAQVESLRARASDFSSEAELLKNGVPAMLGLKVTC